MRITFDNKANTVYIQLKNEAIRETDEDKNGGIIIDYAEDGSVVGIEILNASEKLSFPIKPEYIEF
jgi:uncharacterized protein YuzE